MLRRTFCYLTGYRYNYRVSLTYFVKNKPLHQITTTVALTTPEFFKKFRNISKILGPDLITEIPKYLLKNGKIQIQPICYLGFYKP